jgi:hypothetical protein
MTGGGLYILVAYGSQNIILSGNPDFTYFYLVVKKYSHFSFESATLQVDGPQELFFDQPIQIRAKIQRIGDLLSDLYFTFTLPDIYSKYNYTAPANQYEFQWVRYIGAQIIQDASFFVGGTLVQQIDSDYIIASALTDQDETQYNKWQQMVGDVPELYDPANGQYSGEVGTPYSRTPGLYPNVYNADAIGPQTNFPSIPAREITLPLGFWFSQSPSLSLPLIALQYHECEVQLTLRPIQDLYTVLDPNGLRVRPGNTTVSTESQRQTGNVSYVPNSDPGMLLNQFLTDAGYTVPTLSTWPLNARLQATYIYLTDDERRKFVTHQLTYPVRQVTRYTFNNNTTRQYFELFTHNPVPRLIVIPRRSDAISGRNSWTNYTNWWLYPLAPYVPTLNDLPGNIGRSGLLVAATQQDIIRQVRILCDGNEIQEIKPLQYFNELSSWKYAAGVFPPGLAIYSFALDTSKWMKPSGTLNTSRVKMFQIDVDMWPLSSTSNFTMNYVIYVESLNFFVVESGMGGMKYAT